MGCASGPPPGGVLDLLLHLQELNCEPVRHGNFIGLRGTAVGQVPLEVWRELARQRPLLERMLKSEPTPFRRRQRRSV
jgi:hypothetical protein